MEAGADLKVLSIGAPDMARQLESAVFFGRPVLLVDVAEEVDPVLEPLLAKAYVRCGTRCWVQAVPLACRAHERLAGPCSDSGLPPCKHCCGHAGAATSCWSSWATRRLT
jgi:hypothetical protein